MSTNPIDPKRIRIDLDTQSRIGLNEEIVREYAEAMEAGQTFPAILVFYDESPDIHILAEGFHRFAAHMRVRPNDPILAELRLGTVVDARWASIAANKSHGLRRTNEDKRNAVKMALLHPKGAEMSNVKVAEHVGVSHTTVQNVRKELEATCKICKSTTRTGQDGRTINTARIGRTEVPPGATCATCRYFVNPNCEYTNTVTVPWTAACEDYAVAVPDVPKESFAPPDYDNIVISRAGDPREKKRKLVHQNKRLKGCQVVHLPSDNASLFAVELRNRFEPGYLVACISALKTLLADNE